MQRWSQRQSTVPSADPWYPSLRRVGKQWHTAWHERLWKRQSLHFRQTFWGCFFGFLICLYSESDVPGFGMCLSIYLAQCSTSCVCWGYMHVYVFEWLWCGDIVHASVYVHVLACMWKPKVNIRYLSQSLSTLLLRQGLLLNHAGMVNEL